MYSGKAPRVLLSFSLPFSLIVLNPEGDRDGTRKGIKLGQRGTLVNSAWELGFRIPHTPWTSCTRFWPSPPISSPSGHLISLISQLAHYQVLGLLLSVLPSPKFSHFSGPTAFFSQFRPTPTQGWKVTSASGPVLFLHRRAAGGRIIAEILVVPWMKGLQWPSDSFGIKTNLYQADPPAFHSLVPK